MINPVIEPLRVTVERATTVDASAKALIDGFQERLRKAREESLENGATAAELQPFVALEDALRTGSQALSDAVVANTPAA